jgi:asparagine synthase (glutamine-hydrolysing)
LSSLGNQDKHLNYTISGLAELLILKDSDRIPYIMNHKKNLPNSIIKKLFINQSFSKEAIITQDYSNVNSKYAAILLLDYIDSLRDQLLVKVDRATMSASLEGREPLLDHRLAEFSAQLPMDYKISRNIKKRIFKDIINKYIDPKLLDRPKTGFDLPIYKWLRTDLSYLVDNYLSAEKVKKTAIFDESYVSILVKQFVNNKLFYKGIIWRLIQFQMWYEKWMDLE